MILHLENAIDSGTLGALIEAIQNEDFTDGVETAGRAAQAVKLNRQLRLQGGQPTALRLLLEHLQQNPLLNSAALPKTFTNVMVNQYQTGMEYGLHMDDALMGHARTDISFTLGLTDVEQFEGGELVLEDTTGERSWKLGRGELLLYPSHYLHRVNPVRNGERLAMVGWIQSHIRDSQQREILFDLKCSMSEEFEQRGKTGQYDRLSKSYNNLLRRWAE
ncbi:Fe2+-dependent dioxygenase [Kangiella shandongensis]|uniref:Fe2+-dependent dioxygenase n=1 Tax=Kangiella shandongensis TaxID=2763258 RepID=UPI001CC0CD23|nr:Fe2+-dependent dioxygenase [Kangiella shandongensis]